MGWNFYGEFLYDDQKFPFIINALCDMLIG
jgi:hypothetical protein